MTGHHYSKDDGLCLMGEKEEIQGHGPRDQTVSPASEEEVTSD